MQFFMNRVSFGSDVSLKLDLDVLSWMLDGGFLTFVSRCCRPPCRGLADGVYLYVAIMRMLWTSALRSRGCFGPLCCNFTDVMDLFVTYRGCCGPLCWDIGDVQDHCAVIWRMLWTSMLWSGGSPCCDLADVKDLRIEISRMFRPLCCNFLGRGMIGG